MTAYRFDDGMVATALRYYGLPADYDRFFTLDPHSNRLVACDPKTASQNGLACWAQVNLPATDFPRKKAKNAEIVRLLNLTLDFELPSDPILCHKVGMDLAAVLVEMNLAEQGLGVEDSGAGCHIVLPLVPIDTAEIGGGEIANEAVARIVTQYIKPKFEALKAANNLQDNPNFKLEAFDISRILSLPGTFRPGGKKAGEIERLRVVEYTITAPSLSGYEQVHRVATTLLDCKLAPALAVAQAYH